MTAPCASGPFLSAPQATSTQDDPITQLQRSSHPARLLTQLYSFSQFVERINNNRPVTADGHTFKSLLASWQDQKIDDLINLVDQQNERNYADQHELMCYYQMEVNPDLEQAFNKEHASYPISFFLSFFTGANRESNQQNTGVALCKECHHMNF